MKLSTTTDTWLGAATILSVLGLFGLIALDKPVDQAVVALVASLVTALVHRASAGQAATAALATPADSPGTHELEQAVKFLQQNVRALEARTSPPPSMGRPPLTSSPPLQNVSPPPATPQTS